MEMKKAMDIEKDILVKDLGDVFSANNNLQKQIENLRIKKKSNIEDWDCVTAIEVAKKILQTYPNTDLDIIGESETLIEYKSKEKDHKLFEFAKVAMVCILLFFGSSVALINFHTDVDTRGSMENLYHIFTGIKKENPLIMGIPYSIGIGIGVITFFTKIFSSSKRRQKEPGPMEIELFGYDQDMEKQIMNEVKKNNE